MLKYKVVAVDFDGTLTIKDEYPNVGELNPLAIHYLKEYKKLGGKLIKGAVKPLALAMGI